MPTNTANYNLVKPGQDEFYNVEVTNNNNDIIDAALKENSNKIAQVQQVVTEHLGDDERHINAGERGKWNNEFSTFKSEKDDNATFKSVEKRRTDGTLFAKSTFSEPNSDGNYLVRTYTEYAADGASEVNIIVYNLVYDDDGDWVDEVIRS